MTINIDNPSEVFLDTIFKNNGLFQSLDHYLPISMLFVIHLHVYELALARNFAMTTMKMQFKRRPTLNNQLEIRR